MNLFQRISSHFSDRIKYPITKLFFFHKYTIKDTPTTLQYIIQNKCSVSRYGDGEFDMIIGGCRGFQSYNKELAIRLKNILQSDLTNHIVCLPYTLKSTTNQRGYAHYFWKDYFQNHHTNLRSILKPQKIYYDSLITRFYMDLEDKSICPQIISLLKKIWENRDIVLVEGSLTSSGIGNDLYTNAKSLRRIICPPENAFEKYDEIFQAVKDNAGKNDLILISLGMTATVLAYDLAKEGFQAIDLGHLDIEYEWFLQKAEKKVQLPNKYVNEVKGGNNVQQCTNPVYQSQIIARII